MSNFQRRHYIQVADEIATLNKRHNWLPKNLEEVIQSTCDMFKKDNSAFDEQRFRDRIKLEITSDY